MNHNVDYYPIQPYGGMSEEFTMELFSDKHIPMSPPHEDFGPYTTYLLQSQPASPPMMMPIWEPWFNCVPQQQEAMFTTNDFPIAPMSPPLSITADEPMAKEEQVSTPELPAPRKRQPSQGFYRCDQCDKHFTRPYNLKSHMRTHTNEKPYCCDAPDCTWRFARPHDLKRHQLLHSGVKPHSCLHCNRRFARRDALRRHWKVDTECGEAVKRANATAPQRRGRGRKSQ